MPGKKGMISRTGVTAAPTTIARTGAEGVHCPASSRAASARRSGGPSMATSTGGGLPHLE